jgi:hypothetical protein
MNVSREEAAQALSDINRASDKVIKRAGYRHGAPFFILWGLVWMFANGASWFMPENRGLFWGAGVGLGMVISIAMGVMQSRKLKYEPGATDMRVGRSIGFTSLIMFAFIFCVVWIAQPESNIQVNAIISILFPFIYMAAGIWAGWRLFAIGLVTAVAIMGGYIWLPEYFEPWMAVFGGGSLIAGGIWLRTA